MTTAAGRTTVSYIVKCALPTGHSIIKKDQTGATYTFPGALGLAPGWETGPTTQEDRNMVSACLMAHINTTGQHIPIYLDGPAPLGWGRNAAYPVEEGTFFGDLFVSPPTGRYCGGRGFGSNVVAGRIGDQAGASVPYKVAKSPDGTSTRCDMVCKRDPSGDGYNSCQGVNQTITVWRQFTGTPALSFESAPLGFASAAGTPAKVSISTAQALHGLSSMAIVVQSTGSGDARIEMPQPAGIQPGKNMTVFINVNDPSNARGFIQAYAQDGPAKNYRWNSFGYNPSQISQGDWDSIVVPVPADFALKGSKIGIELTTIGKGTVTIYVDAISFND